jgi:hypothetical protein
MIDIIGLECMVEYFGNFECLLGEYRCNGAFEGFSQRSRSFSVACPYRSFDLLKYRSAFVDSGR